MSEAPDTRSGIAGGESFAGDTEQSVRRDSATTETGASDGSPVEEFGPYAVYERLGQGGMATVHRAEKRGIGFRRPVALKRLFPHVAADPELVKLFVDEARLASHLHHANIAQTYELGRVGDTYFIAMEYASGPTLGQIVRQCQVAALEIPVSITVSVLAQVCDALDYAHNLCDESGRSLRIIHRDVSPANIVVSGTGIVKLIDFGIAKATTSSVKTQTGFIKGKFGYIAPEYITGKIDARVDLFAIGVIAHEMMTGKRLFEGKDDFETMANIREMVVSPPSRWNPRVTADLDDIVMTALERDPAKRWQSASAVQHALASAARGLGVVVGSQQLVEWVNWAFEQAAADSGVLAPPDSHTDQTNAMIKRRPSPRADSSVSIEVEVTSGEIDIGSTDLLDVSTMPGSRRASTAADSDETMPVERVAAALVELEMLTVPTRRPAPGTPIPTPTVPTQAAPPADAPTAPPAQTPTPTARSSRVSVTLPSRTTRPALPFARPVSSPRASRTIEAAVAPPPVPPPPPALSPEPPPAPAASGPRMTPRASRQFDTELPVVASSRDIEVIAIPPGSMFEEPAPDHGEPAKPRPKLRPRSRPRATQKTGPDEPRLRSAASEPARRDSRAPHPGESAQRRSIVWMILLMVVLGTSAMAAAYYWPDL